MDGISVVIPLFNKAQTLSRAIDSVLAQEGVPFEIVVIDDESNDGSDQVALSYGDRIRYFRQPNAGPSAARNRGVREGRYSCVTFLDADDEFLPGCLLAHRRCRASHDAMPVTLVSFRTLYLDGTTDEARLWHRAAPFDGTAPCFRVEGFRAGLVTNVYIGCAAIDRTLFDALGGFDERLRSWEITDFMLRLLLAAPVVGLADSIGVEVRETPGGQSTRTHGVASYIALFNHKLLDVMESVPAGERAPLLEQIDGFLYALWTSAAFDEFKAIGARAAPVLRRHGRPTRLEKLVGLPPLALGAIHRLRRVLRRD